MSDRLVDRVLDPQYIEGLSSLPLEELQQRSADAAEVERETSAVRRSLHRIIDELQRELDGRTSR